MLLLYRVQFACLYFLTCYTCCALYWCCRVPSLAWLLLYCTGLTSSLCRFFSFGVIARRGLKSYVCCSVIRFPARWNSWIYLYAQQFMRSPLLHCFRILKIVSAGPNSCLFCNMWFADADCGLQFLIWLMCSLYLICISLPDCPTCSLLHVMHLTLYIPLGDHKMHHM